MLGCKELKSFIDSDTSSRSRDATSNSRKSDSRNKQMIGGWRPESLSGRGVGDGGELPKILRSITKVWNEVIGMYIIFGNQSPLDHSAAMAEGSFHFKNQLSTLSKMWWTDGLTDRLTKIPYHILCLQLHKMHHTMKVTSDQLQQNSNV